MVEAEPLVDQQKSETVPTKVNDFSIKVGTVNGSGSQTANVTLLRALFRMGIPVSGKNIFPSNIQGLPTWYTIRVNKDCFLARKEPAEVVVAMNVVSFLQDLQALPAGGVFFYSDDIKLDITREDIYCYPMPVKQLTARADVAPALKDYIANMVYVGVLAQLIGIDLAAIREALDFQFKGKAKPIESNYSIVTAAAEWAEEHLQKTDPYRVEKMDGTKGFILADGNTAAAIGSVYGGVQLAAWYPITPASSLAEALSEFLPMLRKDPETGKNTFAVIQAEDELAAIGMAVGAGWAGLRSMTSTSGPGLSLMAEYSGLAYFAEVPVVIWDVQRVGPSTGLPTRTAQADLTEVAFLGHGDSKHIILLPGSVTECFEFGWKAFDLAERFQTPVFVLSDLDFGMNQWMTKPFEYPTMPMDRGKVLWEEDLQKLANKWGRYLDVDGDGIPYRTLIGNKNPASAYFARGTGHDEYGHYSEEPEVWERVMDRLKKKYETARGYMPKPEIQTQPDAEIGIISFGSTDPAIEEARHYLSQGKIATDYLRIKAIPFTDEVREFISKHRVNYVVELNRDGQMHQLLTLFAPESAVSLHSLACLDGLPLTAQYVIDSLTADEEAV